MNMRDRVRMWFCLPIGMFLLIASDVQPARATPVLDQVQAADPSDPFNEAIGGDSQQKLAQVVTAGISGALTEVRVPVAGGPSLLVQIQGVVGGKPSGVVLASETIPSVSASGVFPFVGIDFSAPVPLSKGEQFAIVLSSPGSWGMVPAPAGNPYSGGDAFFDSRPNPPGIWESLAIGTDRFDLAFQTFVDPALAVPEPRTLLLVGFGLATLSSMVGRRHRRSELSG